MDSIERQHLDIILSIEPRAVSHVRRLVGGWVGEALKDDDDGAWRAELASHELLENVMRSTSSDGTARLCVSVISDGQYRRIIVSSNNRPTAECAAEVKGEIAQLHRTDDAFAHYQQLMRESVTSRSDLALGLARIRAEAEMELESFAHRGEVTVVARTTLKQKR